MSALKQQVIDFIRTLPDDCTLEDILYHLYAREKVEGVQMVDMRTVLARLAGKRPVFHSESDFQHALAWEIHEELRACSVRLERKLPDSARRLYLDVWVEASKGVLALELKYKTRRLNVEAAGETFHLADQSAQPLGRYDFCKDIQRLEHVVSRARGTKGCAVFLTNDSAYWSAPRHHGTIDQSFRLHEGRVLAGELSWAPRASEGTTRSREATISLKGVYKLQWRDYSSVSEGAYGKFRYLLLTVQAEGE